MFIFSFISSPFLGDFAKLRKETITFFVSVHLFVRPSVLMKQIRYGNIVQRMCFACWISKAKNIHQEHVIRIAFSRQYG